MRPLLLRLALLLLGLPSAVRAQPGTTSPPASASAERTDLFAGRTSLAPTARALPAGSGHVSLRAAAYAFVPAVAGLQASLGVTNSLGASVTVVQALQHRPMLVATAKWTAVQEGALSVAVGATLVGGGREFGDLGYRSRRRPVAPFVAVTAAGSAGGPGLSMTLAPRTWSVGADLPMGTATRLVVEYGRLGQGPQLDDVETTTLASLGVRHLGRRHTLELGLTVPPSEINVCAESEALVCLPPLFPTLAWGRRLRF